MSKKNIPTKSRKLTAANLQIELLRYLLVFSKKTFTAGQLINNLQLDNNRDSVEYALRKLEEAGSIVQHKDQKYGVALKRLTYIDEDSVENNHVEATSPKNTPKPPADKANIDQVAKPKRKGKVETSAPRSRIRKGETAAAEPASGTPTKHKSKAVEGRVDMTRTGSAYIVTERLEQDVYVAARSLHGALHNDVVEVELLPQRTLRRGQTPRKPEGRVVRVVRRAQEFFMGTLHKSRKYALVIPDNLYMPVDIYVPLEHCADGKDGDKVVVRITQWPDETRHVPTGKVTQVLGAVGGNDFEMKKILLNAGFELSHSEAAMTEAEAIPENISPTEIATRRDFRDILTFTIDPEDAKDFDDALSVQELDNGYVEIGVHIADVTHYLKPDTPLDQEAYRRSTSVYLVDRVNPMLPEKLSNNLCSLVPLADRLTFSAVFTFDGKDQLVKRWFGKTVIHSQKRFTYEEAQTVIEGKPADSVAELPHFPQLDKALHLLQRLAQKMRKAREKEGAIGFETDEVRFRLDAEGNPTEAYVKTRQDAHLLIEDFMLLANKEVAVYIDGLGKDRQEVPFVYRIHDLPDQEKVMEFARFANELGHPMHVDTPKQIAAAYNALIKAARKNDRLKLLEPLAIRTMAKAVYATENIGHYGLGFSHYTHFTSPIRRYADVLAHRLLERNLHGQVFRMDKTKLEEQCKHISNQERKAAEAERESVKYTQAFLLRQRIGHVFDGIISGFVERGFFVELPENLAEGMVPFRDLDDLYVVEPGNVRARGRRYGQVYKLGDRLRVRLTSVDLAKRQIELEVADE